MVECGKVLPGTGRGTAAGGGGAVETRFALQLGPSTMLHMVPLPVPGRIYA